MKFVATDEQRRAIEHPAMPLLVVAGAGTGKTSVMAERILHLVESGQARPDQVLGLTFTNKAAANLRLRVGERLAIDADVTVSTYHAFGAALVADHAVELGLDPATQVLNRAQAWQLLFAVFDDFKFERRSTFRPGGIVDDALHLASRCADHLVVVDDLVVDCDDVIANGKWVKQRDAATTRRELCQVVAAYQRRKRERNLLDYDDQVGLAVRLLRDYPDVALALRVQYPFALLDEYQDTNYAQRVLLQLVYPEGSAITAVGDDMQSIYGFRGAHLGNILEFDHHFAPVERRPLETNRRSGPGLVTLANRIQAQVGRALPKELRSMEGAASTTIECFVAADDADEANEIAAEIAKLGSPWSDHAVLCRKRRLIGAVVSALEDAGVPVDVVGAGGLLERPEVVDLVAWLEVLHDLSATVAVLRIVQGPRYRVGMADLAALARFGGIAEALSDLARVPDLSPAARARLAAFCHERAALAQLAGRLSVLDLAEAVTQRTGLWAAAGDRGRENLLRFFDLAARFAPIDGDPGLAAFVEYLQLLDETEEELAEAHPADTDAVRVMTVHQAKGLEFANVWVPGLAGGHGRGWGIFPDARVGDNPLTQPKALPWWVRPDDEGLPGWRDLTRMTDLDIEIKGRRLDEEWRLFYVACTRAERRLVLSAAHWYPGPADPQGPSEFYEFVAAQRDLVTERFRREAATVDPSVAARERRRARAAATTPSQAVRADDAPQLFDDSALPPPTAASQRAVPTAVSVTALVSYGRCPLQFYWSVVRPLPRRGSAAAEVGTTVHRWIEERSGRQLVLLEPEADDATEGVSAGVVAGLKSSFLASPYANLDPVKVEAPFELAVGGRLVRGRLDAAYERDGRLELVDFKTGRPPEAGDAGAHVQLDIYAIAAVDTWGADPDRLRTTYCWLQAGGDAVLEVTDWTAARLDVARAALSRSLAAIGDRHYDATPGLWCRRCGFAAVCGHADTTQ